jgi:hypothetical protein
MYMGIKADAQAWQWSKPVPPRFDRSPCNPKDSMSGAKEIAQKRGLDLMVRQRNCAEARGAMNTIMMMIL